MEVFRANQFKITRFAKTQETPYLAKLSVNLRYWISMT